jgi:2,4-dienoyl-CoA reductase-like NADH-dependent reductase (Old Yellow Enzyme family)
MLNDPLLQPFKIAGMHLKNRVISTAHAPALAENGMPKERYQRYHLEKALGGLAMTMIGGSSCVSPDSPSVFGQLDVSTDEILPWFTKFSELIHQQDCKIICQISHLGRRTTWNNGHWLPIVAPSRIREPAHRGFPKVLDRHDIKRIISDYVTSAKRCRDSGLDGVEVLQNGHLPGQFLSPDTNIRQDEYGGNFLNRLRFARELYAELKNALQNDIIIGARVEMDSKLDGGLQTDEALEALKIIESDGTIDYFNMNVGRSDTEFMLASYAVPAMFQKLAPWLQLAGYFKSELSTPIIHAARISDIATARYAIKENLLDLVGMTRAHIADPHLVRKVISGQEDRIRPCVGAGYCIDRIYGEGEMLCLHNVATTREKTIPQTISEAKKHLKVVVVGAGPAGLEATRVCAERGHAVVLIEASAELGGQVRIAAMADVRKDLIGIVDWMESEIKLLKVDVRLQQFATTEEILLEKPDVVIIATGGVPDLDYIEGLEHAKSTWDVLSGQALSGRLNDKSIENTEKLRVMVYDDHGQHQAASTVTEIAKRGYAVELVTPDRHPVAEMGFSNFPMYMKAFYDKGVTLTPNFRLSRISREGNKIKAELCSDYGAHKIERIVDQVVIEHGTTPVNNLFQELREQSLNKGVTDIASLIKVEVQPFANECENGFLLYCVGDAVASRNIHAAIYDSRRLCQSL